jgi:N-sulfoglucosamine sulfohydrolase
VLRGYAQYGRDYVVTEYNENAGGFRHPMRSIVTRDYGYIFNPWSNGKRVMSTATKGTATYRRMRALAKLKPQLAQRLDLFDHRVPEELYHYATDPDAIHNLIDQPEQRGEQQRLTKLLEAWMVKTGDPLLEVLRARHDPAVREAFLVKIEATAAARRPNSKRAKPGKRAKPAQRAASK